MASDINSDSSGSDSGSTPEEERIRRLFQTCDGNGDGFIDSHDLLAVCKQLNLENCVEEIMEQLGADDQGRISYSEFLRRRMQLMNEINALTFHDQPHDAMSGQEIINHSHSMPLQQASPVPGSSSTGNWHTSSDSQGSHGATSGKHESWEFDSGARDLSPEPNTLHKLIEAAGVTLSSSSNDLLELANKLHLAALASLKGEVLELNNRLQHASQERDILERQLNRTQLERLRLAREQEDRLDQQAQRYEERLTELHSIIAELSKKLEAQRANVIKEEDECSQQSGDESRQSEVQSQGTSNDNNATETCSEQELSRFECEEGSPRETNRAMLRENELGSAVGDNESCEERVLQNYRYGNVATENRATSCHSLQISQLQEEVIVLRAENGALQEQLGRQEAELNRTKSAFSSCKEERDRLHRRIREMQAKFTSLQSQSSQGSQTGSSPTRSKSPHINPTTGERTPTSREDAPIAKMAERVRLKKMESGDRHILGSELSSFGLPTTKVAEHLAQNVHEDSHAQEIFQILFSSGSTVPENKIKEFEVEMERLNSRIEHLKSQNDLLNLTLQESKGQCDRLSVLLGKYESNNTALQLALSYSDQTIETYEVLLTLLETEQDQILANCRAAGLGAILKDSDDDQHEITSLLRRSQDNRKSAENVARHFLQKLDRSYGIACRAAGCNISPWEDLSSHSQTTSTTSSMSSNSENDFTKADERRLRDYLIQLKSDRASVRTTVLELESIHLDPTDRDPPTLMDSQKLDLENAVIMQELMAMKEEKAELKAQAYLLEKEKTSLELQLSTREAQEQAYLVQIEHFKSELQDQTEISEKHKKIDCGESFDEMTDTAKRESKLKGRIQDLMSTVEKVTKNSELRAQQSVEFVNDLKRANSALVTAFEKSKKKQQTKVKKLEQQMSSMMERHNAQVQMMKQRIAMLEGEPGHHISPSSMDLSL